METSTLERIFESFEKNYFTIPIWGICMIIALFIGLKNFRKDVIYILFLTYTVSGLLLIISCQYLIDIANISKDQKGTYVEQLNTLFQIIETFTYSFFFIAIFNDKRIKIILISICILVIFAYILSLLISPRIENNVQFMRKSNSLIISIEFSLLLILSLYYYYFLLNKKSQAIQPINEIPSFWIVSGIFFYSVISLPSLLLVDRMRVLYLPFYNIMFAIHYISLSILFLCIAKAFLCKKSLTK